MEQDFHTITRISRALWTDTSFADRAALDTTAAMTLLDVAEDRRLERIARGLIERATREGNAGNARQNLLAMDSPFFRLSAQERLILVALHSGRWSYARLSRILARTPEVIQELAWGARVKLSEGPYPIGAKISGANCPEYQFSRPWTQKFLDDELDSPRERVFLPNHLMACASCSQALKRCRDLYFAVDSQISKLLSGSAEVEVIRALEDLSRQKKPEPVKLDTSFQGSLKSLFRQWDVQLIVGVFVAATIYKILH
ncbi:MAG: hypothetical protein ACXWPM_04495 [Bdellovibrionota bacterium]